MKQIKHTRRIHKHAIIHGKAASVFEDVGRTQILTRFNLYFPQLDGSLKFMTRISQPTKNLWRIRRDAGMKTIRQK